MAPVVTLGNTWPSLWLSASKNLYAFYKSALLKKNNPERAVHHEYSGDTKVLSVEPRRVHFCIHLRMRLSPAKSRKDLNSL